MVTTEKLPEKKRKVLCLMDTPSCSTGFGVVARNILKQLEKTGLYDITVLGINFFGEWYDQSKLPFKIYPAQPIGYSDPFGRGKFYQVLQGKDPNIKLPFDIVFTLQDHFILAGTDTAAAGFNLSEGIKRIQAEVVEREEVPIDYLFNWVAYWPVDGTLKPYWVQNSIELADYPVFYTEFGKKEALKYASKDRKLVERGAVINHGVNLSEFHQLSDDDRRAARDSYFKGMVKDDTFLIVNVGRNQIRKDMARTIKIYAEYKKINPKAFLYIHAKPYDQGGDLWEMAYQCGLRDGEVAFPTEFDVNKGVPLEVLNKIYNAADCLLTTTLGEGWGFINTEAMAVKRPILAPNNTAITEILGIDGEDISLEALNNNYSKWRGVPLPCGTTSSEFVCQGVVDNERLRPLTNVDEAVKRLDWVYNSPARVKTMVDNAYEWIKGKDWDIVCQDWVSLFDKAYQDVLEVRKLGHRKIGGERNDICPICDVKFKKCPHGK